MLFGLVTAAAVVSVAAAGQDPCTLHATNCEECVSDDKCGWGEASMYNGFCVKGDKDGPTSWTDDAGETVPVRDALLKDAVLWVHGTENAQKCHAGWVTAVGTSGNSDGDGGAVVISSSDQGRSFDSFAASSASSELFSDSVLRGTAETLTSVFFPVKGRAATGFATAGRKMMRSANGGALWQAAGAFQDAGHKEVSVNGDFRAVTASPSALTAVAVGDNSTVFVSTCAAPSGCGDTWTTRSSLTDVPGDWRAVSMPSESAVIVAGSENNTAVAAISSDAGETWKASPLPSEAADVAGLVFTSAKAGAAVGSTASAGPFAATSSDGGASWETADVSGIGNVGPLKAVASAPSDPKRLVAVSSSTVAESSDAGKTWTVAREAVSGEIINAVACIDSGKTHSCFVVGDNGLVLKRVSSGEWEKKTELTSKLTYRKEEKSETRTLGGSTNTATCVGGTKDCKCNADGTISGDDETCSLAEIDYKWEKSDTKLSISSTNFNGVAGIGTELFSAGARVTGAAAAVAIASIATLLISAFA